jgi:hypothetical protein
MNRRALWSLAVPILWVLQGLVWPALAGPNAGGVLLVHCNPAMEVPGEATFVDGELAACDSAVVQAPADSTVLWFIYAAFPSGSSPRLKVVTFGCQFDADSVGILWAAPRPGSSELRYEPTAYWPYPGSGTMMGFTEALTDSVDEIYAFAGYGPTGETFSVVAHPDSVQGGRFADDGTPSELDAIADFGSLGFGVAGALACPQPADTSGEQNSASQQGEGESAPEEGSGGLDSPGGPGDMTFVEMTTTSDSAFVRESRELEVEYGLRVLSTIPPDGVFCRATGDQRSALSEDPRVSIATADTIPNPVENVQFGQPGYAEGVWNDMVTFPLPDTTGRGDSPIDEGPPIEEPRHGPCNDPEAQTSVYMMGQVGVSLFFVESVDSTACGYPDSTENWTVAEVDSAADYIRRGLRDLSDVAPVGAQLRFNWGDNRIVRIPSEPIRTSIASDVWIDQVMDSIGAPPVPEGHHGAVWRVHAWNNLRRAAPDFSYDWWFTIFVIRDVCDPGHSFPGGYLSHAGLFGPSTTLLYYNGKGQQHDVSNLYSIVAHETCHVFGAPDEYASSACVCDSTRFGYLRETNGNCENCGSGTPCLMRANSNFVLCPSTLAHIGWRDSDGDGILDPIDHPLADQSLPVTIGETLSRGDWVDIFQDNTWVKRLIATDWCRDRGVMLWDGIKFDGQHADSGAYLYTRNGEGSPASAGTLARDEASPVIYDLHVAASHDDSRTDTLSFRFLDPDTHVGRVRATATPNFSGPPEQSIILDWLFTERDSLDAPVARTFHLAPTGSWTVNLRVWDVGAGHTYLAQFPLCSGCPSGVPQDQVYVPELRLSRGRPNPSGGWVAWDVERKAGGKVDLRVVDVSGRCVKAWSERVLPGGSTKVLWNGLDEVGDRVASGRYYLVVIDESGNTRSAPTTIIR